MHEILTTFFIFSTKSWLTSFKGSWRFTVCSSKQLIKPSSLPPPDALCGAEDSRNPLSVCLFHPCSLRFKKRYGCLLVGLRQCFSMACFGIVLVARMKILWSWGPNEEKSLLKMSDRMIKILFVDTFILMSIKKYLTSRIYRLTSIFSLRWCGRGRFWENLRMSFCPPITLGHRRDLLRIWIFPDEVYRCFLKELFIYLWLFSFNFQGKFRKIIDKLNHVHELVGILFLYSSALELWSLEYRRPLKISPAVDTIMRNFHTHVLLCKNRV